MLCDQFFTYWYFLVWNHFSVRSVTNFSFLEFFGFFLSALFSILYLFCLFVCFLVLVIIMNLKTGIQEMLTGEN